MHSLSLIRIPAEAMNMPDCLILPKIAAILFLILTRTAYIHM